MNGIVSQIRKMYKSIFKEDLFTFISFIIFPLVLSLVYGTMNANTFNGKTDMAAIKTKFVYNEQSDKGKILSSILKEEKVKSFIDNTSDGAECEVTISENFNDIKVKNINCSSAKVGMVSSFLGNFSQSLNKYGVMGKAVFLQSSNEDKMKLIQDIITKVESIQKDPAVEEEIISGYRTLDSYEYFGISVFTFTSTILIMIFVNKFFNDKSEGIIKRSFASPISKAQYFLGYAISSALMIFMINMIYVAISRSASLSFKGNLCGVIFIVIAQSMLQAAIATALVVFIKNKNIVNSVMGILIIIPAIAGGAFNNVDNITTSLKALGSLAPSTLMLNAYKSLSITNSIGQSASYIICMFIVALVLIVVSTIKVSVKWEE